MSLDWAEDMMGLKENKVSALNKPWSWPNAGKGKKFTDDQVRAIRKDDRRLKDIAAEYGAAVNTIAKIRNRENYLHVPDEAPE